MQFGNDSGLRDSELRRPRNQIPGYKKRPQRRRPEAPEDHMWGLLNPKEGDPFENRRKNLKMKKWKTFI